MSPRPTPSHCRGDLPVHLIALSTHCCTSCGLGIRFRACHCSRFVHATSSERIHTRIGPIHWLHLVRVRHLFPTLESYQSILQAGQLHVLALKSEIDARLDWAKFSRPTWSQGVKHRRYTRLMSPSSTWEGPQTLYSTCTNQCYPAEACRSECERLNSAPNMPIRTGAGA